MKLAKALKLKNTLAGEVTQLKDLLGNQNVRPAKRPFDYKNSEVLAKLRGTIDQLVKVKAGIAAANVEIYATIFRLAELKGLVTLLSGLDTRHGVFVEQSGYGNPLEVEYVAQLSRVDLDNLVAELQAEIQSLQDALDEYNYTCTVTL